MSKANIEPLIRTNDVRSVVAIIRAETSAFADRILTLKPTTLDERMHKAERLLWEKDNQALQERLDAVVKGSEVALGSASCMIADIRNALTKSKKENLALRAEIKRTMRLMATTARGAKRKRKGK